MHARCTIWLNMSLYVESGKGNRVYVVKTYQVCEDRLPYFLVIELEVEDSVENYCLKMFIKSSTGISILQNSETYYVQWKFHEVSFKLTVIELQFIRFRLH